MTNPLPRRPAYTARSLPVRVRAFTFRSARECAEFYGIHVNTVYRHLDAGTPDRIGLTTQPRVSDTPGQRKPTTIAGIRFPSVRLAAEALGYASAGTMLRSKINHPKAYASRVAAFQKGKPMTTNSEDEKATLQGMIELNQARIDELRRDYGDGVRPSWVGVDIAIAQQHIANYKRELEALETAE